MHYKDFYLLLENPLKLANILARLNLNELSQSVGDKDYKGFLLEKPGVEHYRLLAATSLAFGGDTILDVGTHFGSSALALSYNPFCKVKSYDLPCR